jgi:hypothetical protein
MSRAQLIALKALVEGTEAGGYALPADVLNAHRVYDTVRALVPPEPPGADVTLGAAASRFVASVSAGDDVDLTVAARALRHAVDERADVDQARVLLAAVIEHAGEEASTVAADRVEDIIVGHLRPTLEQLRAEARERALELGGRTLDVHSLIAAPAKVRSAFTALTELATRQTVILGARRHANAIGFRTPSLDASHFFADFRRPLALFPDWKTPAALPRIKSPADPVERLIWIVSPQIAVAEPWLPTVADQDEAWDAQFGEAQRMRANAALSARAYAGQPV